MFMWFWYYRWDGWEIVLGLIPLFFATSDLTKPQKHYVSSYFLNIRSEFKQNQWSPHFSKQSIPGLFYLKPHRKVSGTTLELFTTNLKNLTKNRPTRFQTLTFGRKLGFQKPGICPRQAPGVFIFPEMTQTKIWKITKTSKIIVFW